MRYINYTPSAARCREAVRASKANENRAGEPTSAQLWLDDVLACIFLAVFIVAGFALADLVSVSAQCF